MENRPAYPGVREIFKLSSYDDITLELSGMLWQTLSDAFGNNQLVIEAYLSSKQTLYAEYLIAPNQAGYTRISAGTVRMDSSGDKRGNGMVNWVGFEIPFKLPLHLAGNCFFSMRYFSSRSFLSRI